MNKFHPVTMIARTTPGTHNSRISAQTVRHRLRGIVERHPYKMYVLYAAFLFWPSIYPSYTGRNPKPTFKLNVATTIEHCLCEY